MEDTPLDIEAIVNSGPPIDWYWGIGPEEQGLKRMNMSDEFERIIGDKWNIWSDVCHFIGNPAEEHDTEWRINEANRALDLGREEIMQLTGFKPEAILDKKHLLEKAFKGKKTAPFALELY